MGVADCADEVEGEDERACIDALVEWLEDGRRTYLNAARATGLDGTVKTERLVVVELTESSAKIEGRVLDTNPLLIPGTAWTLAVALRDEDVVPPVAERLVGIFGERCEVNVGFYSGLFAREPAQWTAKVLLPAVRWKYLSSLESLGIAEVDKARELARQLVMLIEADDVVWLTLLPLGGLRVKEQFSAGNAVLRPVTADEYLDLQGDEPFHLAEGLLRHARSFRAHEERAVLEIREARPKRAQDRVTSAVLDAWCSRFNCSALIRQVRARL